MNLGVMQVVENRKNLKTTVLFRNGGTWPSLEIDRLGNKLVVSGHPKCPEYLLVSGHYTKDEILEALWGGRSFTVSQVVGVESLPFTPAF